MKRILVLSAIIFSAYVSSAFVRTFLIQTYYIPTISMTPTLNVNDRVLVIKKKLISGINYGDIIIFYPNGKIKSNLDILIDSLNINKLINFRSNDIVYIKRVIGKEYDSVKLMSDGVVLVNGVKQISINDIMDLHFEEQNWNVPKGQYFVLGDNLLNSNDSRSYGFINDVDVVGKAWLKIYPFDKIELLND